MENRKKHCIRQNVVHYESFWILDNNAASKMVASGVLLKYSYGPLKSNFSNFEQPTFALFFCNEILFENTVQK